MEDIIKPIDRELLKKELTIDKYIRKTNYNKNEIYIFTADQCPNLMLEVGRLREMAFRDAGAGTGKKVDIDEFDVGDIKYKQLIVWDPKNEEIIGGYRFILLKDVLNFYNGELHLATSHMFDFSDLFIKKYATQTIELGRSFVQPKYQPQKDQRKGIFSLDNLWDGLGALTIDYPDIKYFFGKVTLYLNFDQLARDAIVFFMHKHFPDNDKLITPKMPRPYSNDISIFEQLFSSDSYEENYKKLLTFVKSRGEAIPPLVNAYMSLSRTMKTFGISLNPLFGPVEEIGILVTIDDVYPSKIKRHVDSYLKEKNEYKNS
ncbi:MAG TPA: GNAT family N-acyltransferase [Bacteroidales bacterium]|nr:GNAT family N-acetyltransferase [Bacteroidales bacterium]HNT70284.1 GNAT family N-acyltransferase [Bacteroidales bacterium]HOH94353.1 GNAT family N-acyltransferase [Bacteroidales bacterium]HPM40618.1 GNAT family N-acyltransferase [Bacteroidales bacterium]